MRKYSQRRIRCRLPFIALLTFLCACVVRGAVANVERMIVIGIDGLSPDGILNSHTPNFRKLMKSGAYSMKARAVMPTSSSPNWASMIMGAGPEQHGVTSNDWMPDKFDIAPAVVGPGNIFPTIFGVMREQRPQFNIAVFHDWKDFGRLLETNTPSVLKHVKDSIETAAEGLEYWRTNKPHFLFLHFDGVDHAGHSFGWKSAQYYKQVEMVDSLIGAITDGVEEAGLTGGTVFLVTADHGGKGKKHGGNSMDELLIPWILKGPGVHANKELKTRIDTFDTGPTIAYIFGLKAPECWIGKPVFDAFKNSSPASSTAREAAVPVKRPH